jgi:hypothetical protein
VPAASLRAVRPRILRAKIALPLALITTVATGGCGGGSDDSTSTAAQPAPAASSFPPVKGTLDSLTSEVTPSNDVVVLPAGKDFSQGQNRFSFGVFTTDGQQVTDAQVAIYAAPGPNGQAAGPFPAKVESLETDAAFTAQTTSDDPDAAKAVYVTDIDLDKPGEWRMVAVVKQDGKLLGALLPSIEVKASDPVPSVGDLAPVIHTPTVDDVGNIQEIDTRVPPSGMHDVDFADVVGKKPVVLLFATPALCTSRVCGPVVDVAEQVKSEVGDDAAFVYMEIYNDNNPNKGPRPQVQAYNLTSEPWLFVIDADGKISTRIEGAFSVSELEAALDRASA